LDALVGRLAGATVGALGAGTGRLLVVLLGLVLLEFAIVGSSRILVGGKLLGRWMEAVALVVAVVGATRVDALMFPALGAMLWE
jgi:hypothetical protein